MSKVKEVWTPKPMTASGRICARGGMIGGFLCTTGGTLVVSAGEESGGATIVASITVVAATYYPMPFECPLGAYATLGGGAAGTFAS